MNFYSLWFPSQRSLRLPSLLHPLTKLTFQSNSSLSKASRASTPSSGRKITINVPVVFMAQYLMVLRGATSLRGALEGVGHENWDFFWALKWHERNECQNFRRGEASVRGRVAGRAGPDWRGLRLQLQAAQAQPGPSHRLPAGRWTGQCCRRCRNFCRCPNFFLSYRLPSLLPAPPKFLPLAKKIEKIDRSAQL